MSEQKPKFRVVSDESIGGLEPEAGTEPEDRESRLVHIATAERRALGVLLRETRERQGKDLRGVAEELRIRLLYLQAIEEGRFEDLPGAAYAYGFLRSYADFLNLDSDELVRRFKTYSTGLEGQTELNFPIPSPESRIPKGAVIFASLLVALLTYSVWYSLSSRDSTETAVPEVPDLLAPAGTAGPGEQMATTARGESLRVSPGFSGAGLGGAGAPEEEATAGAGTGSAPAAGVSLPDARSESPVADMRVSTEGTDAPSLPGTRNAAGTPDAGKTVAMPSPGAAPGLVAAVDSVPPVVSGAALGSRVLIRAKGDAWVQIRDERRSELLLSRTLRTGETFAVPDRGGLSLMTGNAGALEILVDGVHVPSLGSSGTVLRSVSLDADRLRGGSAVIE